MTGNRKDPKRTQPRTTAGERVDIAPVPIPIGKYWHAERSSIFGPKADTPIEWARSSLLPISGYAGQYGLATVSAGGQTNVYGRDLDSGDWRPIGAQQILNEAGYPTGVYGLISITDLTFDGDVFIENMKLISWDNTPEHTAYQYAVDCWDDPDEQRYVQGVNLVFPGTTGPTHLGLGQAVMNGSIPVTMAENQTPIPTILGGDPVHLTFPSNAAPINEVTAIAGSNWRPLYFTVNITVAPVTSEDFTCTLDSNAGVNYDSEPYRQDLTVPATTDITSHFPSNIKMLDGDQLRWQYPNSDGRQFYITLVYEVC